MQMPNKQPGPQPATTFCITRIAGKANGKREREKEKENKGAGGIWKGILRFFRSFSSFAGDATQHGKVGVGRIQQTLEHGQCHGVNVADSYLQDEMERAAPGMEMDYSPRNDSQMKCTQCPPTSIGCCVCIKKIRRVLRNRVPASYQGTL